MIDDEHTALIRETLARFVDGDLIPLEPHYLPSKLPALRIITCTAHLLIVETAQVGNGGSALLRGRQEARQHILSILTAILVLLIQLVLDGKFLRVRSVLYACKCSENRLLHFRPADCCCLCKGGRGLQGHYGQSRRRQELRRTAPDSGIANY